LRLDRQTRGLAPLRERILGLGPARLDLGIDGGQHGGNDAGRHTRVQVGQRVRVLADMQHVDVRAEMPRERLRGVEHRAIHVIACDHGEQNFETHLVSFTTGLLPAAALVQTIRRRSSST
jgi:hypothetical protein